MQTLLTSVPALATAAVLLSGCGGGAGGATSGAVSSATGVASCLNDEDFLVQPSAQRVEGSSPAGANFNLTLYASPAAAKAAAKKEGPKTTAVVENGVVDFGGNPSPSAGVPPARISKTELATIRHCIDRAKRS